jgi:hypothetical protein
MKLDEIKAQQKFLDSNFQKFDQQLDCNRLVELGNNNEIERNFLTSIDLKKLNSVKTPPVVQNGGGRLFSESFVSSGADSGVNFRNHSSVYDNSFKLVDDKYSSSNSDELPTSSSSSSSSSASSTTTETSDDTKQHRHSNSTENEDENATTTTVESISLYNKNHVNYVVDQEKGGSDLSQQKNGLYFKTERSIQLSNNKAASSNEPAEDLVKPKEPHERDDFDDLVDLSHRPEKIEFKKESSLEKKRQKEAEEKRVYNALCSASLPPLPPLPYSFVKLEHKAKLTPKSSSFLSLSATSRVKPPSAFQNENTMSRNNGKSEEAKVVQSATTRLIIPINTEKRNKSNSPFCITTTSSVVNKSKPKTLMRSNSLPRNSLMRSDRFDCGLGEIDVQIIDTNKNVNQATEKNCKETIESEKQVTRPESPKQQKDVGREWEQISKIFASLELLLNEVVEDTSNNLKTSSCMPMVASSLKEAAPITTDTTNHVAEKICQELSTTTTTTSSDDLDEDYVTDSSDSNNVTNSKQASNANAKNCRRMNRSSEHMDHLLNKKKLKYIEISEFLKRINMAKYEKTFLLNGYDDLNFIVISEYLIKIRSLL